MNSAALRSEEGTSGPGTVRDPATCPEGPAKAVRVAETAAASVLISPLSRDSTTIAGSDYGDAEVRWEDPSCRLTTLVDWAAGGR